MNNRPCVLFVDDEANILRSIRREFFDASFTVLTVESGAEGLKMLGSKAVDLVVSDVKMPEMDGITFLEEVKKRHPDVHRIILSGYVEQTMVIQAVVRGVAGSYMAKPWQADELRQNIEQILRLKKLLTSPALLATLSTIDRLPSLPTVYHDFLAALVLESSPRQLASILNQDVSLITRILQIANSAFYGAQKISSIERAIIQLGTNIIKDITLTVSIAGQMTWKPAQLRQLEEIFQHSALVSRLTADLHLLLTQKRLDESDSSAALTHDVGKIILLQHYPDLYQTFSQNREAPQESFFAQEKTASPLGVTHCDIGAYFLSRWNLPNINVSAALYHHEPDLCGGIESNLVHMIALANQLSNQLPTVTEEHWLAMSEKSKFTPDQRRAFLILALEKQP
jgi:HD-like signal output (HDOD) protein/CheY-like chemotaxis protein